MPKRQNLMLFRYNKDSKYAKNEAHFSFKAYERVFSNAWANDNIKFYSSTPKINPME